jgi:hypothetical protein
MRLIGEAGIERDIREGSIPSRISRQALSTRSLLAYWPTEHRSKRRKARAR